jgi:hypothetical protein
MLAGFRAPKPRIATFPVTVFVPDAQRYGPLRVFVDGVPSSYVDGTIRFGGSQGSIPSDASLEGIRVVLEPQRRERHDRRQRSLRFCALAVRSELDDFARSLDRTERIRKPRRVPDRRRRDRRYGRAAAQGRTHDVPLTTTYA